MTSKRIETALCAITLACCAPAAGSAADAALEPIAEAEIAGAAAVLDSWFDSFVDWRVKYESPYENLNRTPPEANATAHSIHEMGLAADGRRYLDRQWWRDGKRIVWMRSVFDGADFWSMQLDNRQGSREPGKITQASSEIHHNGPDPCKILEPLFFHRQPLAWYFQKSLVAVEGAENKAGRRWLKCRLDQFPHLKLPRRHTDRFVVWLDPVHDYLPARVESWWPAESMSNSVPVDGWALASALDVESFAKRSDDRWIPERVRIEFSPGTANPVFANYALLSCAVGASFTSDDFDLRRNAPVGTPIVNVFNQWEFVGGDEGKRIYLERHPEQAAVVDPPVDAANATAISTEAVIWIALPIVIVVCLISSGLRRALGWTREQRKRAH